jgi:hypothetical protein
MRSTLLAVAFVGCMAPLFAQGPSPVITIIRETIKEGKGAAHVRAEQAYANVFRKHKYPVHYLGMTTTSGPNEAWFVNMYPSFAAIEEADKLSGMSPLKQEVEAVETRDGDLRVSSRTMTAVYRGDLSYLPENAVTLAKTRYVMVATYRVRMGHEDDFMAGSKMILDGLRKGNVNEPVLTYQVIAGAPSGNYLLVFPIASMKSMDEQPAREKAMLEAIGPANFQRLMKSSGDVFLSMETMTFAISAEMSYVPKETEDVDPGFWRQKTGAAPAKAKEKAAQ